VSEETQNVLYYGYAVPGIETRYLQDGLEIAADTTAEFGKGKVEWIEVLAEG
jgi:hypothetical protein